MSKIDLGAEGKMAKRKARAADDATMFRENFAPFARPDRRRVSSVDGTGSVQVKIGLYKAKGNRTRTITVRQATVSAVAAVIERALFGDAEGMA